MGNVVRRVLHIIREEDLSLTTAAMGGLDLLDASDDDEDVCNKGIGYPVMSAAVVAAAARSTLRPPSLQTLLEGTPESASVPYTSSSGADSESKSKCTFSMPLALLPMLLFQMLLFSEIILDEL